ncbi:MAG: hypothetical protein ACLTBV_29785 [Enterocloster bolteae]
MYERLVSRQSGIMMNRIRQGKAFLGDEKERFQKAMDTEQAGCADYQAGLNPWVRYAENASTWVLIALSLIICSL